MAKGPERKRHNTLDFGTEKPSLSGRVLGALRDKPSYRRLLSLPDGAITASKNPGSEIFVRLQAIIEKLDQSNGDKNKAFSLLKEAYEILIDVTVDQKRNAYFVEGDVLTKLKDRHNGDTAAIQKDYDRMVSERKARFVQDTQEALINFAGLHRVMDEFSAYIPTHDYAVVPGVRSNSSSAVDQLLGNNKEVRERTRGRTIPGMPVENLEVPKIPQAGRLPAADSMRVPFRIPPGKSKPRRVSHKTDPFIYGRPSEQNASSFDHEELTRQHDVKAASIRDGSFVGRLQDIAPSLIVDDSQPPSAPKTLEHAPSEDSALKDFERLFVPLFQELLLPKLSENHGNFMKAVSAISKRTYVHAMSEKSPFCSYLDNQIFDQGGDPVYRKFSRRVLEKRAKKARLHFNKEMHEYLQGRLNTEALRGIPADKLDYEVSQTAKRMFSILRNALVEGEQNLGSFIWLSYYLLEDKREEAIAFYSELYDLIHPLYKHAHEGVSRTPLNDDSNRITIPDTPDSKLPGSIDDSDIEDEKTYPGIENIFDVSGVPSSHPMIEEEPVPYSTKSDIPPRESHIVIPERVPSAHPKTLVPPDPDLQPVMTQKPATQRLQPTSGIDDEITREFKVPTLQKIVEKVTPPTTKRESVSRIIQPQQAYEIKHEPKVVVNEPKVAVHEPTIPSQRKMGLVVPNIPQAPRVPSLIEIESDGSPDAETVKRKPLPKEEAQPSRWGRWKARTKKRLGALALVAAAGTAAFLGIRSQQPATTPVETTTQKTAEPPKVVPPKRVAPAPAPMPTTNAVKPPVDNTPQEVGPKPSPTLDDGPDKMGIVAKADLTNVRTKRLRDALTTGATPDNGRSSYSSQLVNTLTNGQALSTDQTKQLEELRDKVNRGSYASAMKKWGHLPPHKVKELAAPGSTYEDRSLLRSLIKMHGDPAKWAKKTRDPKTGTRGLYQDVYRDDMEYYEKHYEAEFLAYGMGDKGNIHTRKPNNRTITLQKDGRWLTYAYDVGRIVGYFEEGTKTGMIDSPSVPGKRGTPLPNIPGQHVPAPEQKYGSLSPFMQPHGLVPGEGMTIEPEQKTIPTSVRPGLSSKVNMSFIRTALRDAEMKKKRPPLIRGMKHIREGAAAYHEAQAQNPSRHLRLPHFFALNNPQFNARDLLTMHVKRAGISEFATSAVLRQIDRLAQKGALFTAENIGKRQVTLKPSVKVALDRTADLALKREQDRLGKAQVDETKFATIRKGVEKYDQQQLADGLLHLPRALRLQGGTTFWMAMEQQITSTGQPAKVQRAALTVLKRWRSNGVQNLPFSMISNDSTGIQIEVKQAFIDQMNEAALMASGRFGRLAGKLYEKGSKNDPLVNPSLLKNSSVNMAPLRPKPLTENDIVAINGVPRTMRVPAGHHPIDALQKTLIDQLRAFRAPLIDNPFNIPLIRDVDNSIAQVRAICAGMKRQGLGACIEKGQYTMYKGGERSVAWNNRTTEKLARVTAVLNQKPAPSAKDEVVELGDDDLEIIDAGWDTVAQVEDSVVRRISTIRQAA